jgi:hypothetical protein
MKKKMIQIPEDRPRNDDPPWLLKANKNASGISAMVKITALFLLWEKSFFTSAIFSSV